MFKRILAFLLVVVMVFSLAACGNKENANQDEKPGTTQTENKDDTQSTQPSTPDKTDDSGNNDEKQPDENDPYPFWTIKEVAAPTIAPLTSVIKTAKNSYTDSDIEYEIAVAPFDYDVDAIYSELQNNEWIKKNTTELVKSIREYNYRKTDKNGDLRTQYEFEYRFADIPEGKELNSYDGAFELLYQHETGEFDNIHYVRLNINKVPADKLSQESLLELVKLTIGEEYAEYLVYGADTDGADGEIGGRYPKVETKDMHEYVVSGDTTYSFIRWIDDEGEGLYDVSFIITVQVNPFDNDYYGYDEMSIYKDFKYKFENYVTENFGGANPLDLATFGDNFFKTYSSTYNRAELDSFNVFRYYESTTGRKAWDIELSMIGKYVYNENSAFVNLFEYELDVYENADGEITYYDVEMAHDANKTKNSYGLIPENVEQVTKDMVSWVLPIVDLEQLTFNDGFEGRDMPFTFLDKTAKGYLNIDTEDGDFSFGFTYYLLNN